MRFVEDLVEVLEAEIRLARLDLQQTLDQSLRQAGRAIAFWLVVGCGFLFLNVGVVLWLRSALLDSWIAFLMMGLVYLIVALAWLFVSGWRKGTGHQVRGPESQRRLTLHRELEEAKARFHRDASAKSLYRPFAIPLVLSAIFAGFLAAPKKRTVVPGRAPETGLVASLLGLLSGRLIDRLLDLVLSRFEHARKDRPTRPGSDPGQG
jgi:hypothetical protein